MSDEAAFRALGEHAVAKGLITSAELEAGLASDSAPPIDAGRDSQGRFAAAPSPAAPRDTPDMQNVKAMADSLVKQGRLTRQQADQMLAADLKTMEGGIDPSRDEDIDGMVDAVNADREAKHIEDPLGKLDPELEKLLGRPADPSLYKMPSAVAEKLDLSAIEAIQKLGWQAQLSQPIFNAIAEAADRYAENPLPDVEFKLLTQQTTVQLEKRYGAETPKRLEQARRLVNVVMKQNPGLLGLLSTGFGSDYSFCVRMIEHASVLYGGKK